jgi:hypothetical protein
MKKSSQTSINLEKKCNNNLSSSTQKIPKNLIQVKKTIGENQLKKRRNLKKENPNQLKGKNIIHAFQINETI